MKRIGITQRVSTQFHNHAHDCLDASWSRLSFSHSLAPVPLPNMDAKPPLITEYLSSCDLSGVILSGGNDIASLGDVKGSEASPVRDAFETACVDWALKNHLPVLAVCRGFQFLNLQLGGGLTPIEGHVAVRHEVKKESAETPRILKQCPASLEVNSFHNYAVAEGELAPSLRPLFKDQDGHIEAAWSDEKNIFCVMWHPERENPVHSFDREVIDALFKP